jgi:flagellin-like protein
MKANRKFVEEDEAVSAVIGVILMVAITVAIAATVYVYVSGMLTGGTKSTPSVSMTADPTTDAATGNDCLITIGTITQTGIEWSGVGGALVDITDSAEISSGITYTWPSMSSTITGGDIIDIDGGGTELQEDHEYRFTLSYNQTGGTMGTVTWMQT